MSMTRYLVIRCECLSAYDEISCLPQFWNKLRKKFGRERQICHDEITCHLLFCNGDKK